MKHTPCPGRPLLASCPLESFDHQLDPYIGCAHLCRYCYVLDEAETDWSEEILYHADLEERLPDELEGLEPQTIYLGYWTDPYQPGEADLNRTRAALEIFQAKGFSASILTKSDLVARDADILSEMPGANVSVSVAFTDDRVRRIFEHGTIGTERRIEALKSLREAGVGTSALLCPVIPYITDAPQLIETLAPHVDRIWIYGLSVRDRSRCRRNVTDLLREHFPDLADDIDAILMDPEHVYWTDLRRDLQALQADRGPVLGIHL